MREFNIKTLNYFTSSVVIIDKSNRQETNWWGIYNKNLILSRSIAPTKQERKEAFDRLFKMSQRNRPLSSGNVTKLRRVLGNNQTPEFIKKYARYGNYAPLIAYSIPRMPTIMLQ